MLTGQKLVIITAPSGSGKTTIVNHLLKEIPQLSFSVSACTRPPRAGETNGVHYYFISVEDFQNKIQEEAFAEYEMVYPGKYYGTLKSELARIWQQQQFPLIDIDVHGAMRLKLFYGEQALRLFIKAPSVEELERRLRNRGTETEASLKERLDKAAHELSFADNFDHLLVNDDLPRACAEAATIIRSFLNAE